MGKINYSKKALLLFACGFICGLILALSCVAMMISYRIDTYHQKIELLSIRLAEKEIQLEKLSESLNKKKFILKEIELHFHADIDKNDEALIKTSIMQKLDNLIGKEVKTIDTELVTQIIDKRIMDTGISQYKLRLVSLVLSDSLKIWINADKLEQGN